MKGDERQVQVKTSPREILGEHEGLAARASEVLRQNDMGGWTRAAPNLYPHQWSWDSAFIAIGLAHLDVLRAARELSTLFAAQWATAVSLLDAPPRNTSGLCQPAVHAIAALHIWEVAAEMGEEESAGEARSL